MELERDDSVLSGFPSDEGGVRLCCSGGAGAGALHTVGWATGGLSVPCWLWR